MGVGFAERRLVADETADHGQHALGVAPLPSLQRGQAPDALVLGVRKAVVVLIGLVVLEMLLIPPIKALIGQMI